MENSFYASILDLDINAAIMILEKLSGKETLKLCGSNTKLYNMCKKYENIIWKKKLLRDYQISEDEIFGSPKSYYMGLEQNRGFSYYFGEDINDVFEVVYVGREKESDSEHIFIPGAYQIPIGEKVIIASFEMYNRRHGGESTSAFGKNLPRVLEKLVEKIKYNFWYDMDEDLEKQILSMRLNSEFEVNKIIEVGYGGDIPIPFELSVGVHEVTLLGSV